MLAQTGGTALPRSLGAELSTKKNLMAQSGIRGTLQWVKQQHSIDAGLCKK